MTNLQKSIQPIPLGMRPQGRYTVVSLFTGAGGLDIGFEQTGRFKVLACVEKVPAFCETIRRNRDAGRTADLDLRVYEGDISDTRQVSPQRILDDLGLKPGELDLVIGGPPCQTFSTTGKRATVQDPRGTLLWRFLHFIDVLQPKMFVMENVRGLMSAALRHRSLAHRPDKGGPPLEPDEEPGSVLRLFIEDLHNTYRMDCFEVNAVNYGVPQLRERVFFIGNHFNHVIEFPEPTHGESTHAPRLEGFNGQHLKPFRTLRDAIAGLVEHDPVIMDFSPRKKKYLSLVPPGGNWRSLPDDVAKEAMGQAYFAKGGRSGWWRRLTFDLPSPAILTMPNHAGTALCHPTEVRALTLRECACIQEFPSEWEFCGKAQEQYAQVGNAVPTGLARVCGEVVAQHLGDIYDRGLEWEEGHHLPFRIVYVKSHIRTRKWFKAGQEFLWQDGKDNSEVSYSPAKTLRKERTLNGTNGGYKKKAAVVQTSFDMDIDSAPAKLESGNQ